MKEMAARELEIMQELHNHPNIVRVHDYKITRRVFWIFLEYCDMNNLKVYLQNNVDLPLLAKLKIMSQSSSAVRFMHNQKPSIIHRDIKLENIMMKREGSEDVVKLADFGLSKICDGQMMTANRGSAYFMAPEVFSESDDFSEYNSSIDVFSLGLVYLVLLQNRASFDLNPLSGTKSYTFLLFLCMFDSQGE